MKSLLNKTLTQFIVCTIIILLLATPLFYLLTKHYYAEDMIDIIEATQQNQPIPELDLEQDIMQGVMIQFPLISGVLGIAIILMTRFVSKRLWKPFEDTLKQLEHFKLESETIPLLPASDIKEFNQLNQSLNRMMTNSLKSYKVQKEFTENASHELQTPLAAFQSKLDVLLQFPDLTEQQAEMMQGLYQISGRLSRLNRNLLLLAKIDNKQYNQMSVINVMTTLEELLPFLENMTEGITLHKDFQIPELIVNGNKSLLESMINNLIVNAVRYNLPEGEITITIKENELTISNTSNEMPLDSKLIFNRFYHPAEKIQGNGLGLAIVKAICDYHSWSIQYHHENNKHYFTVHF